MVKLSPDSIPQAPSIQSREVSSREGDDVVRLEFGMYSGGSKKGAGSRFGRRETGG